MSERALLYTVGASAEVLKLRADLEAARTETSEWKVAAGEYQQLAEFFKSQAYHAGDELIMARTRIAELERRLARKMS